MRRTLPACVFARAVGLGAVGDPAGTQAPGTKGEWRYYGADAGSTKYSRLDHINTSNVTNLQIAWRWSSPDNQMTYLYQGRQHIVMADRPRRRCRARGARLAAIEDDIAVSK